MVDLDIDNAKQSFIQLIDVDHTRCESTRTLLYMTNLVKYIKKCYKTQIILRPTLILTDQI